jgi:hypothetical protein
MTKIKAFPKQISVTINKDDPSEHFLSADTDSSGMCFSQEGEKVRVAVYKLDHVREVTVEVHSEPVR